jgi:aspartate-semialdehyde dehydrogenase
MKMKLTIGIVGATGAAGQTALDLLAEDFPSFEVREIKAFASQSSVGKRLSCGQKHVSVIALTLENLESCDVVLFATDADISKKWIPLCAEKGIFCVDKSSAFRMKSPLVVPEVNASALKDCVNFPVAATPNCCATPLAMVLAALDRSFGVSNVVVSTYQSVSGTGKPGIDVLRDETQEFFVTDNIECKASEVYPKSIAFNVFPYVAGILDSGDTDEELKIIAETQKIMSRPDLNISATSVRVPTFVGHAESVTVSLNSVVKIEEVKKAIDMFPGVVLVPEVRDTTGGNFDTTNPASSAQISKVGESEVTEEPNGNECEISLFPTPREVTGRNSVFVGRVRQATAMKNGVSLWLAADNLRKGAALNALQIVDACVSQGVLSDIKKKFGKK